MVARLVRRAFLLRALAAGAADLAAGQGVLIRRLLIALAWAFAAAAAAQPLEENPYPSIVEESEEEEAQPPRKPPPAETPLLQDRPVMLRAGAARAWESNMFHSPDPLEERISTVYAGLSVDKSYAQQRFRLDITGTAYRYESFPYLDFEALSYLGAWTWRLGPRIGGALSATREQSLADYGDFRNPGQLNVRTTENSLASADAWLFGGWHLTGGLSRVQNRYSVPFPQEGSYRASGTEAGARWVAPSANWAAFNLRSLDGRYVDRAFDPVALIDDGFRRTETEALALWRLAGKSSFEGRVAWIDYRSNHFAERDFSGLAARLRYLWTATPKLALNALLVQELEPWADATASYRVEQRVTIGPQWQPAARTTLRLDLIRAASDFRGAPPGFAGTPRRDHLSGVNFEAEWRALRNLSLKAAAQRYRQSSTDPVANYRGTLLTAGLSFAF